MTKFLDRILKRDGTYVSRPVLNREDWAKWAEKFGVPNPLGVDALHVTIIASLVAVSCKPQTNIIQVYSNDMSWTFLGPDASVLAVTWCDWCLSDRCYQLQSFGAVSSWPEYRPHMSISMDAKGFELSDDALAAMPPSIILGPEVFGPFAPVAAEIKKSAPEGEGLMLEDAAVAAAGALVQKGVLGDWGDLTKFDRQTVQMIAAGQPVAKSSLEALEGKVEFATPEPAGETHISNVFKRAEEDRMVYGFASVSISKGDAVVDSHKHEITTKSLRKLCHGLIKGSRAGKFDHAGDQKTEIVEAMVFDTDIWKSMGDYFEAIGELDTAKADVFRNMKFEGLMTGFYCATDESWVVAKNVDFELSIGCEEGTLQELK